MAQTLTRLLVHVVFSTKDRQNTIAPDIEHELYPYVGAICRTNESPLLVVGGTSNHLYLLISMSKNLALSRLIMDVKKDSSKWIKTKGPRFAGFHWQDGYGAFSLGESQLETARRYIGAQKVKHQSMTFQDEFVALLEKYGVPYDSRYVWA
jgi:putative transposase